MNLISLLRTELTKADYPYQDCLISRNKPLVTIIKELALEKELLEKVSILWPEILGNTSNSQQSQQNITISPPSPRNNRRMPSTLHMPLALRPSTLSVITWQNGQVIIYISFLFFFFLDLLHKEEVQESVTCHMSQGNVTQIESHDEHGKIVHRPCSSCISSI